MMVPLLTDHAYVAPARDGDAGGGRRARAHRRGRRSDGLRSGADQQQAGAGEAAVGIGRTCIADRAPKARGLRGRAEVKRGDGLSAGVIEVHRGGGSQGEGRGGGQGGGVVKLERAPIDRDVAGDEEPVR